MNVRARQKQLLESMRGQGLGTLLVTHLPNVRYLCGFTGSSGALAVAPGGCAFFTDGRYTGQAHEEVRGARVVITQGPPGIAAARWLRSARARVLGIEGEHLSVAARAALQRALGRAVRLRATAGLVERVRQVKDAAEIAALRRAVLLGSSLFEVAVNALRPGISERSVAAELEYAARRAGADGMSFETIVAAGPRSALPHGVASARLIPRRGFVVLDFGVILAGYCSDMTRTVYLGRPSGEARRMYEAVLGAQQAAISAIRPGVAAGTVDEAARRVLGKAGYGKFFTHSTGHGVGLEIHEAPRLAGGQSDLLAEGMVITVEPGIYVPGRGGVRIEDMVVVTRRGCEVLTPTTKELIALEAVPPTR
jgi:Xaa-Pro aminopeptidase